jgi:SAM-dependent methyltransferase
MTVSNEAMRRRWNDADWVKVWPKREPMTDTITPFLLEALALTAGERVLDVGSGGGKTTIAAAKLVGPAGDATGADISIALTDLATQRAADAGIHNVSFVVADMQQDGVDGAPFDVAMSQFGVMFFDEPVVAFTNIHAHLAPGGRIAFACWQAVDRNPWFVGTPLAGLVPPPPPPEPGKSATGPFALADLARTQGILEAAGFAHVHHTEHDLLPEVPQDSVVDDIQLRLNGVPDDKMDAARELVAAHLAQFATSPGMAKLPLAFQIFHATASSD